MGSRFHKSRNRLKELAGKDVQISENAARELTRIMDEIADAVAIVAIMKVKGVRVRLQDSDIRFAAKELGVMRVADVCQSVRRIRENRQEEKDPE